MSVPFSQFSPHGLHRMYVDLVTRGFPQFGQSGSSPTSLTLSCGVISSHLFVAIIPSPRPTFCAVGRNNLTPQPDVFTLVTNPDSRSRFHVPIVNALCAQRKQLLFTRVLYREHQRATTLAGMLISGLFAPIIGPAIVKQLLRSVCVWWMELSILRKHRSCGTGWHEDTHGRILETDGSLVEGSLHSFVCVFLAVSYGCQKVGILCAPVVKS